MRQLTGEEIAEFAGRAGVRKVAVENFLGTMGEDEKVAGLNCMYDAGLYGWDAKTVKAIRDGIKRACRNG